MKVLVVDDMPEMRTLLSWHLKKQGYQIAAADCGEEALRMVAAETPDLILMDVGMPGMNGLEVCRRLKADPAGTHIPVILVTAYDSDHDIATGLDAGADDYLTKPISPTVLAARVRAVLRIKTAADSLRNANRKLENEVLQRRRVERALSEAEDLLRQSQKLEAVGRLAGGVAHQFNNLLQVIGGYAKCAMQGLGPEDSRRHDLQQVINATETASNLTHQLLGFSRRKPLERVPVNLNQLVCNSLDLARAALGRQIELQTALDDNLGTVYADAGEIQQALLNLCLNARDAMPSGGSLRLKTERVAVDQQRSALGDQIPPGEYAVIHVADTGCGMTRQVKERIFEPFFTTKEVGKGTGLGLANVHGVVQQHGGVVLVDSEVGKGTVFRIFLPLSPQCRALSSERESCLKADLPNVPPLEYVSGDFGAQLTVSR